MTRIGQRVVALLFYIVLCVALATPMAIKTISTTDGLVLKAAQVIRYQIEYNNSTIVINDAVLASNAETLANGIKTEQRNNTLRIKFPYTFTTTVSPNGMSITIVKDKKSNTVAASTTVGPSKPDDRMPLIVPLNNANPQYVAGLLQRVYNIRVEVDERQRSLIIFVKPEDQILIQQLVSKLDLPRPQVMFEAEILEVNQYMTQSLGIDYKELFSLALSEGKPASVFEIGDITRSSLSVKVGFDLLKTTGAAKTLAQPRVTATDGIEARLNATQTTPIVTAGTNNTVIVNNVTTGITLRFLPKITSDGEIESSLSIAVSTPTGFVNNVPKYSTREANTTVRVRNGEPIVIGGLLEERNSSDSRGIPGFMDVPVLGELFKTTTTDTRSTDLVIMVTPYLVNPTAPSPSTNDPEPVGP